MGGRNTAKKELKDKGGSTDTQFQLLDSQTTMHTETYYSWHTELSNDRESRKIETVASKAAQLFSDFLNFSVCHNAKI